MVKNGLPIKEHYRVAYFNQQKAGEGNDKYTTNRSASKWKFVAGANLHSFEAAPEKYVPQYGGFCAYGTSKNHLQPAYPKAWTTVKDKLYLNDDLNARQSWINDTTSRIKAADVYWPALNKMKAGQKKKCSLCKGCSFLPTGTASPRLL